MLDVMGCQAACYEWADSYDSKVWQTSLYFEIRNTNI